MQVCECRQLGNNVNHADQILVCVNIGQHTINTGKWTMCYDKCVKFNQRQNFKIHLWNLSFNTVIMGIILY